MRDEGVAVQVFILATFLTIMWFVYFAWTVREWWQVLRSTTRTRKIVVVAFRRMLTAWCLFTLPMSFFLRTGLVIVGAGDDLIGQIVFFTLAGSNVVGATYAVVSLWLD